MALFFDLRQLVQEYEARTGLRLSYNDLGRLADVSPDTIKSIASRHSYNVTLQTLDRICSTLGMNPVRYLVWQPDDQHESNSEHRLPPSLDGTEPERAGRGSAKQPPSLHERKGGGSGEAS